MRKADLKLTAEPVIRKQLFRNIIDIFYTYFDYFNNDKIFYTRKGGTMAITCPCNKFSTNQLAVT